MEYLAVLFAVAAYLLGMCVTLMASERSLLTRENLPLAIVAGYFWPLVLAYRLLWRLYGLLADVE